MIYNEDCLIGMRKIEDESIDMIITDPPYGISYQSAWRPDKEKRHAKIKNDSQPFIWFLHDGFRVLKDGGGILCFCRWDTQNAFMNAMQWAGFKVRSSIVWNREQHGSGDVRTTFAPMHENILFGAKGRFEFPDNKRPKDVISCMRLHGNKTHPNEKPVKLLEELISYTTREGDTVLDPFIGSGVLPEACIRTGRKYIGFEIDKGYFEAARERIGKYA
jgi:site-specific DNA-methyltransferase (adenine-specific)